MLGDCSAVLVYVRHGVKLVEIDMASSSSKSARLLSGIEGVSDRALSRILDVLKKSPAALHHAASSRQTLNRQALAAAHEVGTVKHTFALTTGLPIVWEVLTLQDLFPYLCNACPPFCQLLGEVYAEFGADWHAVLYCDGLTPGAVLAPENKRKSIVWYATILEFGSRLCHQELWCCLACMETTVSKLVPAQLSGLTRHVVKDMVCGDRAANTAGIVLPLGVGRRPELVRIHYHATLADEEALSLMLGLKGASGIAPCAMRCWCVGKEKQQDIDRGLKPLTARGANIVDITCVKKADIVLKCDADVWDDCEYLAANAEQRAEIAMCVGINYHPDGILFDRELRRSFKPSTTHRYDPLHILFSNGILASEIMLFFKEAKRHVGVTFAQFREYAERVCWHSPEKRFKPQGVFSAAREKSSDASLKAGASELIAVYAVLRQWALAVFGHISAMRPSMKSLLLLLDVVDLVLKAATTRLRADDVEDIASRLDIAVFTYLEAFADGHGRGEMKHKHHELCHLADQLRKDKRLLWCFTVERKHIVAKSLMQHNRSLRAFARGAVSRMLMAQIGCLNDNPGWVTRLDDPAWDFDDLGPGARMSRGMRFMDCKVVCGNPLFVGHGHAFLILVVACVAVDGRFGVLGHQCLRVRGGDPYSSEWAVQPPIGQRLLVPADAIQVARHWRFAADRSRLTVLH